MSGCPAPTTKTHTDKISPEDLIYPGSNWCNSNKMLPLNKPGLAVDIGAFDGTDAVAYAMAGHRVLSFEPSPSKKSKIEKKIVESLSYLPLTGCITFHPVAIGKTTGKASFHVNAPVLDVDRQLMDGDVGSQQDAFGVPWEGSTVVDVEVHRLDEYVKEGEKILFLKVDVQGYEADVIAGAESLLCEQRIDVMYLEIAPNLMPEKGQTAKDLLRKVQSYGYICSDCNDYVVIPATVDQYVDYLEGVKFIHRGVNHGGWSNVVCFLTPK